MMKNKRKHKKIDFLLENKDYRRLQLYLYLISIIVIVIIYFLIITIFSSNASTIIISILSLLLGIYLVFNRNHIVRKISNKLQDEKITQTKKQNKIGLKNTLSHLKSKQKKRIKLNIGGSQTIKDKIKNILEKFKKNKNKDKYIEIK